MLYSIMIEDEIGLILGFIIWLIYTFFWALGLKLATKLLKVDLEPLGLVIIVVLASFVSMFPYGEVWSALVATFLLKRITDEQWGHSWWTVAMSKALIVLMLIISTVAAEKWQERRCRQQACEFLEEMQRQMEAEQNQTEDKR